MVSRQTQDACRSGARSSTSSALMALHVLYHLIMDRGRTSNRGRILYVDDEIYHSSCFVDALRDDGYEVFAVDSVDSALAIARRESIDLAIVDIMLPPGESFSSTETHGGSMMST